MAVSTITSMTLKPYNSLQLKIFPSKNVTTIMMKLKDTVSAAAATSPLQIIEATNKRKHVFRLGVGLLAAASVIISAPWDARATRLNYYATVGEPSCELTYARSGLGYCDVDVGSGEKAPRGQLINIHYTARFADGTVFDSSYKRGRPLTMRIGVSKVIKGLDQGILGDEELAPMQVGGQRKLLIPPHLAYGPEPAGCFSGDCNIPANATLVYDIKFVEIYSGNRSK